MKRCGKWILGIVSILLWVVAVGLGLELWARWEYRIIDAACEHMPEHPDWKPPAGAIETPPEPNTGVLPATPPIPEADDHLGARFAAMNEADRATYADLREEVIALYGPDGHARSTYGCEDSTPALGFRLGDIRRKTFDELLVEPNTPVLPVLERVVHGGAPATVDATIPMVGVPPRVVAATLYPMQGLAVCLFRDVTDIPVADRLVPNTPPKDSEWLTPWFEYRKNLVIGSARFTNNVGFHDEDVILPKPPGVVRIVCIGGSTTLEGSSMGSTYPNRIEHTLRERFHTKALEVINCGVGGLGSFGESRRAIDYLLLQPDLALHYNFVNDLCHAYFPMWENEASTWQRWLRRSMFVNLHCNSLLIPSRRQLEEQVDRLTFRYLRRIRDAFAQRGIEIMFCSFACPDYSSLSKDERHFYDGVLRKFWKGRYVSLRNYCYLVDLYNTRLRAFCAETGSRYIPVAEDLKGGANYFTDICHMTPAGIQRKAEIIAGQLEEWVGNRIGDVIR